MSNNIIDKIQLSGVTYDIGGGGGTVESAITSGSTNAVESKAIWSAVTYDVSINETLEFDNTYAATNYPSGCNSVIFEHNTGGTLPTGDYVFTSGGSEVAKLTCSVISWWPYEVGWTSSNPKLTYVASEGNSAVTASYSELAIDIDGVTVPGTFTSASTATASGENHLWINENTYRKDEVYNKSEINVLSGIVDTKLDATAYTPTVVDSALNVASTNPVQNQALYSELRIESETTLIFEGQYSTNYPAGCTKIKVEVVGSNNYSSIDFYDNDNKLGDISISNYGGIFVTNNFQGASYERSGTTVIISYPTVQNVTKIQVSGDGDYVYKADATVLKDQVVANTTALANKQDTLIAGTNITISGNVISATGGGGGQTYTAGDGIDISNDVISVTGKVSTSDFNTYSGGVESRLSEDEEVTAAALNDINDRVSEDEEVTAAALNYLNEHGGGGGGNPTVELTQAEYDALVTAGTVSADTYYIITDATPVDMSNYYTTAQTNSLLSGKQNTLVSGTNIKTINNESILGSGNISVEGKAIEAGRGISVATGATADTISVSLPISAGTGNNSIIENNNDNIASGQYSHAEGCYTIASGRYSHAEGFGTIANNDLEHASGYFNVSNTGESISAQTLFSVGNGAFTARHNAFEIRQNGDIYISSGGTDIKLQDSLGGTISSAITRGDTNAVAGGAVYDRFDEVEQVTAQALNVLNESLSGKQDTLSAGTNITIVDNVISAEGGGKAIEAGRGISVTTGETADTVSFNLPISANTNNSVVMGGKITNSFTNDGRDCLMVGSQLTTNNGSDCCLVVGYRSSVKGDGSAVIGWESKSVGDSAFVFGTNVTASTSYTFATGYHTIANNNYEHTSGRYNVSNTGSTNADKTLFSVGNGTAYNARHNAFEIRQNGDIYCSDGTNDVKLQDTITATAANTTALGGLKLVKLTQSAYDNLQNKDSNTLYVIVN